MANTETTASGNEAQPGTAEYLKAQEKAQDIEKQRSLSFLDRVKEQLARATIGGLESFTQAMQGENTSDSALTVATASQAIDVFLQGTQVVTPDAPGSRAEALTKIPTFQRIPDLRFSFTRIRTGLGRRVDEMLQLGQKETTQAITKTFDILKKEIVTTQQAITTVDRNVRQVEKKRLVFETGMRGSIEALQKEMQQLKQKSVVPAPPPLQKKDLSREDTETGARGGFDFNKVIDTAFDLWLAKKGFNLIRGGKEGIKKALPKTGGTLLKGVGVAITGYLMGEYAMKNPEGPYDAPWRVQQRQDWANDQAKAQQELEEWKRQNPGKTPPRILRARAGELANEGFWTGMQDWWNEKKIFQPAPKWAPGTGPTGIIEDLSRLNQPAPKWAPGKGPTGLGEDLLNLHKWIDPLAPIKGLFGIGSASGQEGVTATPEKVEIEKPKVNLTAKESLLLKGSREITLKAPQITIDANSIIFKGKVSGLPQPEVQTPIAPRPLTHDQSRNKILDITGMYPEQLQPAPPKMVETTIRPQTMQSLTFGDYQMGSNVKPEVKKPVPVVSGIARAAADTHIQPKAPEKPLPPSQRVSGIARAAADTHVAPTSKAPAVGKTTGEYGNYLKYRLWERQKARGETTEPPPIDPNDPLASTLRGTEFLRQSMKDQDERSLYGEGAPGVPIPQGFWGLTGNIAQAIIGGLTSAGRTAAGWLGFGGGGGAGRGGGGYAPPPPPEFTAEQKAAWEAFHQAGGKLAADDPNAKILFGSMSQEQMAKLGITRSVVQGSEGKQFEYKMAMPTGEGLVKETIARSGRHRPVYQLSERDMDMRVLSIINGEAKGKEGVDAVIDVALNRLHGKGYGGKDLYDIFTAPGQFTGRSAPTAEQAEFIKERMRLKAAGKLPDITHGANEYRAAWYTFGEGRGGPFARDAAAQGNLNLGGNIFARRYGYQGGEYAAYAKPIPQITPEQFAALPKEKQQELLTQTRESIWSEKMQMAQSFIGAPGGVETASRGTPLTPEEISKYGFSKRTASKLSALDSETQQKFIELNKRHMDRGFPALEIASGYRSPEENASVGGAMGSEHLYGKAIDIAGAVNMSKAERDMLIYDANQVGFHGLGDYSSGKIHLDTRAGRASWGRSGYSGAPATAYWWDTGQAPESAVKLAEQYPVKQAEVAPKIDLRTGQQAASPAQKFITPEEKVQQASVLPPLPDLMPKPTEATKPVEAPQEPQMSKAPWAKPSAMEKLKASVSRLEETRKQEAASLGITTVQASKLPLEEPIPKGAESMRSPGGVQLTEKAIQAADIAPKTKVPLLSPEDRTQLTPGTVGEGPLQQTPIEPKGAKKLKDTAHFSGEKHSQTSLANHSASTVQPSGGYRGTGSGGGGTSPTHCHFCDL